MDTMHKIRAAIMKILGVVITLLFILMTLVGTYQIVTRYFFNRPSTISEELLTYSFTWMSLLASAYVFGKRDHMRMGFMADKLTGPPVSGDFHRHAQLLLCSCCHGIRRYFHHQADHDSDYGIPAHLHGMDLHHRSHCRPSDYGIQRHECSGYAAQRFQ